MKDQQAFVDTRANSYRVYYIPRDDWGDAALWSMFVEALRFKSVISVGVLDLIYDMRNVPPMIAAERESQARDEIAEMTADFNERIRTIHEDTYRIYFILKKRAIGDYKLRRIDLVVDPPPRGRADQPNLTTAVATRFDSDVIPKPTMYRRAKKALQMKFEPFDIWEPRANNLNLIRKKAVAVTQGAITELIGLEL